MGHISITERQGQSFVTIIGERNSVTKCHEAVRSILMHHHHESTHPGEQHDTIEVHAQARAAIIGKNGSELRHIQNNWRVRVYMHRETVSIVGLANDVARSTAYVKRMLARNEGRFLAETAKALVRQRLGNDAVDRWGISDEAVDHWGDEEAVEEWMHEYLYRRR